VKVMIGTTVLAVREAFRGFRRHTSIFAVAVLTLTLGMSLSTAMLSVAYGVVLRPLSYDSGRRLVVAWAGYEGSPSERDSFTEQAVREWRERAQAFDGVAGFRYEQLTLLDRGEPADLQGAIVSPELFSVLDVRAELGATFDPALVLAEHGKVVLLSHNLWRQRFGGDPQVTGQAVNLGGEIYTVTGVMPDAFDVPSQHTAFWIPLRPAPAPAATSVRSLVVIARLRPSISLVQADAEAANIARQLAAAYPDAHRGMRIHLVPFFDELIKESRPLLIVASAAALLVLLICCANVSNLLLMRAIVRRSEFGTRLAIGARRQHLLGVIAIEGLLLSTCSGIIGVGMAHWLIAILMPLSPVELPRAAAIGQDLQIPIVAAGAIVLAALLISSPAALEIGRLRLSSAAAVGARSTSRRFAAQLIVAVEVAIAVTLVAGSSLMGRTILSLRDANPGWKTDHLLAAQIMLPQSSYREEHQIRQFYESLVERLRAAPGVVSVAASSAVPAAPLGIDMEFPIQVPGEPADVARQAAIRLVTPGYFKTLGIPLLEGRDLDENDADPRIRRVVVNKAFARKHLPESPSVVGKQVVIMLGGPETYEIVGTVGDVHHYGMLRDPKPEFYLPYARRPIGQMGLVVRTGGTPAAFAPEFRKHLWALDPALPVASTESMDDLVRDTWNDRSFLTMLLVCFTVVVVVLTIVGIFSVVTYSVSQQVKVFAIHMALGAQRADVLRLVLAQSARTLVAGVASGLAGAWMLGRGLEGLLYGVSATDPRALLIAIAAVILVAAIGVSLPSWRAANVEPMTSLRIE
jgi:putative ABC transport system permease protein